MWHLSQHITGCVTNLSRTGDPAPGCIHEQEGDDMEDLNSQVCTPQHALQAGQIQHGCIVHHPALTSTEASQALRSSQVSFLGCNKQHVGFKTAVGVQTYSCTVMVHQFCM